MIQILTEICKVLKNWFIKSDNDIYFDKFTIRDNTVSPVLDFLQVGQYYRIVGSVFNDGVHTFGDESDTLIDETFDGAVWAMYVPKDVLDLDAEITAWVDKNRDALASPYTSESFGGYSYTKATTANGSTYGWQDAFKSRLNRWRKI